jgi:hypothetical protein
VCADSSATLPSSNSGRKRSELSEKQVSKRECAISQSTNEISPAGAKIRRESIL